MRGIIITFERRAADRHKRGRFPAIAAKNGNADAKLLCLQGDQTRFGVIAGNKNAVRVRRLDGRELRVEILVATAVILLRDDFPAARDKSFLEKFREPQT